MLYFNRIKRFVFLWDVVFLNLAIVTGHYLVFGNNHPNFASGAFIIIANLCWCSISLINRSYQVSLPPNINNIVEKVLMTLIYQSLSVLGAIYFLRILNVSRGLVMISFSFFALVIIIQRVWLFHFLSKRVGDYLKKKVIIIGNKGIADSLVSSFTKHPELGYQDFEYIVTDDFADNNLKLNLNELLAKTPDEIYICYKEMNMESLDKLILFGDQNSIKINVVYDVISSRRGRRFNFDDLPIVHLDSQPEANRKIKILKRSFDVLFASLIMLIGSPVFCAVYLITKLTSKGKAFYKQERIGKNGKPFYIYKFRSMYVDAERLGPQLSKENDPRITQWGMIMRKTRLDELPQFWNALKGDMSIVGYRPERRHFIEEIAKKSPEYQRLLSHKPGITSLGQVHYGYAENVDQMVERLRFDLLYFCNLNLQSDVNIILRTVKVMVQGKGR